MDIEQDKPEGLLSKPLVLNLKDDIMRWALIKIHHAKSHSKLITQDFDNSCPGGHQLNADLLALKQSYGQDYIELEVGFPPGDEYPAHPFILRVVSPRCRWYTGVSPFHLR